VLVWVPLLVLPVAVNQDSAAAASQPITWLLRVMGSGMGVPFAVLAATAPLLQRGYSSLDFPTPNLG
jgi:hypothetical protein